MDTIEESSGNIDVDNELISLKLDEYDGFDSINLDDEFEECDICHQCTTERIVHVILSDEFTRFEGSHEKHEGSLTKAHEVCLEKWAEIIERNIKLKNNNAKIETKAIDTNDEVFVNESNGDINVFTRFLERKTEEELTSMKNDDIKSFLQKLEDAFEATSAELVEVLKTKDRYKNEISGQQSHIEQLVKMETKSNTTAMNSKGDKNKTRPNPRTEKWKDIDQLHIKV